MPFWSQEFEDSGRNVDRVVNRQVCHRLCTPAWRQLYCYSAGCPIVRKSVLPH